MRINPRLALSIATAALMLGTTPIATAASACKGLDKGACERKSDCHWVDPYTRKDGVKVSGHCRSSGKRQGGSATSTGTAPRANGS
ncbi:hypothetical protein [Marichromatium bheemlicum]|uniref:Uncharacterized protein n=1 Tax=Marichromatium bheemlicum TaxID=365339 RepID=A0ABX1ICW5_9GAMM|nr:hypothetical protein [Marichromatium bheemlicum]NKN34020.1 hypothetical protein [Marichromatium bheemlicum]